MIPHGRAGFNEKQADASALAKAKALRWRE
jgi:hypothetical protein